MTKPSHSPAPGPTPRPIRAAFLRSLLVGALLLALVVGTMALYRWLNPGPAPQDQIKETRIDAPLVHVAKPADTPPEVAFTDITQASGIDFKHHNGATGQRLLPEAMGSGLGFFDYDRDGDPDLLLINARPWTEPEHGKLPTQALYRNDGPDAQGVTQFTDVTRQTGLDIALYGMAPAFGDVNGDGWVDLFITAVGQNHLLLNEQGHFREVSMAAGVTGSDQQWSTSAAFLDFDRDGDLDLYVGNYVHWTPEFDKEIDFRVNGLGRAYGAPNHFPAVHAYFYRNDGVENGVPRFTDISASVGIQANEEPLATQTPGNSPPRPAGKALGVRPLDYDGDGWVDLLVANDTTRNFLFHNQGNGHFEEIGVFEGLAYDRNGMTTGAMGIDAAWYHNDQDLAVIIGNFANEMSSFMVTADGKPPFADEAMINGVGPASRLALTFGVLFLDYDLDGRLDLFQTNGHLEPDINQVQPSQHHAQKPQLFWNCGDACRHLYQLVTNQGIPSEPLVGRAAAYADMDGDGDLDLAISQNGAAPRLYRNDQNTGHPWLRIALTGKAPNTQALGAMLTLTSQHQGKTLTQKRDLMPTRGYLSQVEAPVTFGLGAGSRQHTLEIRWPDGSVETHKDLQANQVHHFIQAD